MATKEGNVISADARFIGEKLDELMELMESIKSDVSTIESRTDDIERKLLELNTTMMLMDN